MIPSLLWSSCSRGWDVMWEILYSKQVAVSNFQWGKNHFFDFEVSDPPWHERALLTSQSRQIEWTEGGRNILTRRQIAGGSSHKPGGAGHRKQTVLYSEWFVQCPGETSLPQTITPWFSRRWLCYETCESTRTEQTWDDCFSAQSLSLLCQLLREVKVCLPKKGISIIQLFFFFAFSLYCVWIEHFVFCNTPHKRKYDYGLSSYMQQHSG